MIGRIQGVLLDKTPALVVINVSGIGYEVEVPTSVFCQLSEVNTEISLYTHFIVRDDAHLLYGFCTQQERDLFRLLIKVNGVGPKLALALLSGMNISEFIQCINDNDSATLVKIPGVGLKTAKRLLIEMKDKIDRWSTLNMKEINTQSITKPTDYVEVEVFNALISLGYKSQDVKTVVSKVLTEGMTTEEALRQVLKKMM